MTSIDPSVVGRRIERAATPWIERVARLGFSAKGIVYIVIGILSTQAALGRGGSTTNPRGALRTIAERPFGSALLVVVGIGLIAYACWRFVEAWKDPNHKGNDAKGWIARAVYVVIGLFYIGLALAAFQIARGSSDIADQREEGWTARLLSQPFGRWLVGLVGVAVIAFCLYRIWRAATGDLSERLGSSELSANQARWARRLGSFGLAARSLVYGLMGLFLIQAARTYDAAQAGGLDESLQTLASQPRGAILLGLVAVGLVAYGVYMLLIAWYRQRFVDA